ncbi:synaptosomal-associated protein 23-like isoform X2 [Megalobrama amblycephala]|uniref:synaptosomal-associated protein 23-like isoform X2 n=1 Tax=Megalobrama amblycephala TaxID=75352 RepID=UPI002013F71A|nr:synaptosomal-associated protein 23-like isoform X2 [Megalobrama amblycephala]XP_048047805.1 synaptosomal-associated protein 23-like isoform X2 [Megalobrama amblycephala]
MPAESQSSRMADMSVDEITIKANRITDESVDSCRRMLQTTQESLDVGGKTLTMLDEQEEKLRHVKQEMDQIEQDMKKARKNLNELSKWCGLCLWPSNRLKSTKTDRRYKQGKKPKESKRNVVSSQQPAILNASAAPSGPYIKRITNDEREDEMEENLKQVGDNVRNLKIMALNMTDKLNEQNQIIEDITDEVIDCTHDVVAAEKKARKHQ